MTPTQSCKLLTIDVWDTLLRRHCHPDSIKLHVARYLLSHHQDRIATQNRNAWQLLRLRQQAEKELGDQSRQQGLDDEYRHLDVYHRWLKLAVLDNPAPGTPEHHALIEALHRVELEQECHVTFPDPDIRDVLAGISAEEILFLSDFYMPATAIQALLHQHGFETTVNRGIVSCDVGLNKRSGRLYQHVQQMYSVEADQHLHIGDNPHADIQAAQRLGIRTILHQPEAAHQARQERERSFSAREESLRQAIAQSRNTARDDTQHPAYRYGQETALLWIGFVLFIQQQSIGKGNERVYFLTREGEFFLRIYRLLGHKQILGCAAPPADLLEVSRIATFAASLQDATPDELMRLWSQYSQQSPHALFSSLGLTGDEFISALARHGLALHETITYPWQDARMQAFLADPAVADALRTHINQTRSDLLCYLRTHDLSADNATNIGIVDIGWRGTIQDNLAHTLPTIQWHGYYLALNRYLNPQPANSSKQAWGPNLNQSQQHQHLLDFVTPLEMLSNSPHGSVTGYRRDREQAYAERHIDEEENRIYHEAISHYQTGVLDSLPFWANYLRTHAYSAEEIQPIGMAIWHDMVQHPPAFLAEAYFRLKHNETFGLGTFIEKNQQMNATSILLAACSRKHRNGLKKYLDETGWIPGLFAHPATPASTRYALRLALQGAKLLRKLRKDPA